MHMRKIALVAALALAGVPAGALAAKPSHPATPANTNASTNAHGNSTLKSSSSSANAKVTFVLHGTLTGYTAANGATNGSVTINVKSSNFHGKLNNMTLTFVVTSNTHVTLNGTWAATDKGVVKVRAAKTNSTWTGLTASQVIDQTAH
jgi:hypothetical protein